MQTLKEQVKTINDMSLEVYRKSNNSLAPNIIILGKGFVLQFMFPLMETDAHKNEIALMTICVGSMIDNINFIAFNAESWTVQVDPQKEPEIFKKYSDNPEKLKQALFRKYPSISRNPHRKEVIMAVVCDGVNTLVSCTEIIRDKDRSVIDLVADDRGYNEKESTLNPRDRFSGLLAKANNLKAIYQEMQEQIDIPLSDDHKLVFMKQFIKHHNEQYNLGVDEKRCLGQIHKIMNDVKSDKKVVILH